jgi:hypothetical protein
MVFEKPFDFTLPKFLQRKIKPFEPFLLMQRTTLGNSFFLVDIGEDPRL